MIDHRLKYYDGRATVISKVVHLHLCFYKFYLTNFNSQTTIYNHTIIIEIYWFHINMMTGFTARID